MAWGEVELETEVRNWLEGLDDQRWAQAMFHLDLLEERGVLLGEPYTRQLSGKLRSFGSTAAASASGSATGSRRGGGSSH
jgi:hypothetical protein